MQGYGLSHSGGDIRPNINMLKETATYAIPNDIHTSPENGDIKEKSFGGSFMGLRNKIAMPRIKVNKQRNKKIRNNLSRANNLAS